jgi:hypothetical protein
VGRSATDKLSVTGAIVPLAAREEGYTAS